MRIQLKMDGLSQGLMVTVVCAQQGHNLLKMPVKLLRFREQRGTLKVAFTAKVWMNREDFNWREVEFERRSHMMEFKSVILSELSNAEGKINGTISRGEDDASFRAASAAGRRGDEDNEREEAEKQDVQMPLRKFSDARLTAVESTRSSVNEETNQKRELAKSEVRAKLKLLGTTGEDEEDSACLPRSTNFDCLLSSLEPGPSRRVIVNFEHEQSGHEVLRVRCASRSRKLLLELRVQLLRFRECDHGEGQCIAFNARGEDIEWWVLQFNHYREMIRFQQRTQYRTVPR